MMYELLEERKNWLDSQVEHLRAQLAMAPEGKIRCREEHGKTRYYLLLENTDKRQYLGENQKAIIAQLIQKKYDQRILPLLERELKDVNRLIKSNTTNEIDEIFRKLSKNQREMIQPIQQTDEDFCAQWEDYCYETLPLPKSSNFVSEKGDIVRSKSELIISNILFKAGIPYRYECPLELNDARIIYPDFTVLNVKKRKVFYWEHFGMMDNYEYYLKTRRKLQAYENNNYLQGKNLIITEESSDNPLNTIAVWNRIEAFLR